MHGQVRAGLVLPGGQLTPYGNDVAMRYSWSFFNAVSQMLAIGYGGVNPVSEAERRRGDDPFPTQRPTFPTRADSAHARRAELTAPPHVVPSTCMQVRLLEVWSCLISMLLGATLYAIFVASLTSLVAELDASARDFHAKMDMVNQASALTSSPSRGPPPHSPSPLHHPLVNQYVRHAQLPRELRSKLRAFYSLLYPAKRSFDEKASPTLPRPPLSLALSKQRILGIFPHSTLI